MKAGFKKRRITLIYFFYWFMVSYMIAALVFWYIALNIQNEQITRFKVLSLDKDSISYTSNFSQIKVEEETKTFQYIGEGLTFLLLIIAGAVVVFRMLRKQLLLSKQQKDFMMAITHELKTPISVLKLNLETMQKRKLDSERQNKLMMASLSETDRLNALCSNMLLLNEMDALGYVITKEDILLNDIISECINDHRSRNPDRDFIAEVEPGLRLIGDHMMLKLALNNLLDNAIKYSSKNVPVVVKGWHSADAVNIQVIDEGEGISETDTKRIFEKFYRGAGKRVKGTGIGLYVTKQIVNQNKGSLSFQPNRPKGSIFTISFAS